MAGTEAALDVVKEYQASRKKLDSRRWVIRGWSSMIPPAFPKKKGRLKGNRGPDLN